ncbi:hypothetical protein O2W18_10785 [Modestobacter sp. VKM Ac-2983]|uniref:hypothetical protein n=1 Tax=Modestobacter sp. VKM Ac-2983 TaxID=3004137 RepID=UPI0022ABA953|nr:hypothetical protein [Modestobacter sp. VKM Ac-2983]MCZ2805591.1 hypothetical protein [Modestobacter sp. VKM Ac-2983]
MATLEQARTGRDDQTRVIDLAFPGDVPPAPFSRADLVVTGVDHSSTSYEVRVFLNDPDATAGTPRTAEHGYAGRYTVFGHGGCYGGEGHCDAPAPGEDLRLAPPLTSFDTYVTITGALQRLLAAGDALQTITLVPVSLTPRRADRGPAPELLHFDDLTLQTYLTATDADQVAT